MTMAKALLTLLLAPQPAPAPSPSEVRVLYICSIATDARLKQQYALLRAHEADIKERDLKLSPILFTPETPESKKLLSSLKVKEGEFTILLIGKDGGEKLRQHTPISYEKLAANIDAMPMRQEEMRHKE